MAVGMNPINPLFGANRLKLGIFCTNGKGASQSLVPEAYRASWAASVKTAQLADRAGFEAIVPYARWKGYVDGSPAIPAAWSWTRSPGRLASRRPRPMPPCSPQPTPRPSIRSSRPSKPLPST